MSLTGIAIIIAPTIALATDSESDTLNGLTEVTRLIETANADCKQILASITAANTSYDKIVANFEGANKAYSKEETARLTQIKSDRAKVLAARVKSDKSRADKMKSLQTALASRLNTPAHIAAYNKYVSDTDAAIVAYRQKVDTATAEYWGQNIDAPYAALGAGNVGIVGLVAQHKAAFSVIKSTYNSKVATITAEANDVCANSLKTVSTRKADLLKRITAAKSELTTSTGKIASVYKSADLTALRKTRDAKIATADSELLARSTVIKNELLTALAN